MKYEYDSAGPSLDLVTEWTNAGIGFYEMKLAPDGTLFISSRQSNSEVDRPGIATGIYSFDGSDFKRETTWDPYSLLIADDNTVYAKAFSDQLYIFDGGEWSSVTITGSSQNRGMAFDDLGNIWIASTTFDNNRDPKFGETVIYSYDPDGGAVGPTYTLEIGTTPVGVGKDAAGNSGLASGRGDNVIYPAGYESVIAVAASDSGDKRARFSSTGPAVELIAPGVSILSTMPGDGYGYKSGTSMAAPHVSGVAALVWAANLDLTNYDLRTILQDTAEDLGLAFNHQGHGLVRADLAVAAAVGVTEPDPVVKYTLTLEASPPDGGSVSGSGEYAAGETVNISAIANTGYEFENWTEDGEVISNDKDYSFDMPARDVTLVANFKVLTEDPVDPDPITGMVTVSSIDYAAPGPHLRATVTVVEVDETGNPLPNAPVAGAAVSIKLNLDDKLYGSDTGTTGSDGKVTFSYHRVPSGTYNTIVTAVDAGELTWNEIYPENSYTK